MCDYKSSQGLQPRPPPVAFPDRPRAEIEEDVSISEIEDMEDFINNFRGGRLTEPTFHEFLDFWASNLDPFALSGVQLLCSLDIQKHPWLAEEKTVFSLFEAESFLPPDQRFLVHFLLHNILLYHPEKHPIISCMFCKCLFSACVEIYIFAVISKTALYNVISSCCI